MVFSGELGELIHHWTQILNACDQWIWWHCTHPFSGESHLYVCGSRPVARFRPRLVKMGHTGIISSWVDRAYGVRSYGLHLWHGSWLLLQDRWRRLANVWCLRYQHHSASASLSWNGTWKVPGFKTQYFARKYFQPYLVTNESLFSWLSTRWNSASILDYKMSSGMCPAPLLKYSVNIVGVVCILYEWISFPL